MSTKAGGLRALDFKQKRKEPPVVEVFIEIAPGTPVEFRREIAVLEPPSGEKTSGLAGAEVEKTSVITFEEASLLIPMSQFNRIMAGLSYTLDKYDGKKETDGEVAGATNGSGKAKGPD